MKVFVTLALILSVVFMSCQKEISYEDPNGTGGTITPTVGGKLIRVGTKNGSDSTTTDYTYNAANRLIGYKITGTSQGQQLNESVDYVRNSSNVITQQVYKGGSIAQYGLASLTTDFTYDAASSQYKYGLTSFTILGNTYKDSMVYVYDSGNKLISTTNYENAGSGYVPYTKDEYTYSGSNLATYKTSTYNDTTKLFDVDYTATLEYDSKVNPMKFPTDAPILGMTDFYSANNLIKQTYVAADPTNNQTITSSYIYNSNNMPTVATATSGGGTSVSSYYYQ